MLTNWYMDVNMSAARQQQFLNGCGTASLLLAGLILVTLATALSWHAWNLAASESTPALGRTTIVVGSLAAGAIFLLSCLGLRQVQPRWMLLWILLIGAACRLILLPTSPVRDTDYYRYLWDGAVWLHGYNPWQFSPAAVLAGTSGNVPGGLHRLALQHDKLIRHINHNSLPTIYPPVSDAVFAAAAWLRPFNTMGLKALLLLFDTGTAIVIALILKRLRLPSLWLLIYWWNPVVINAFAIEAHLDSITLFFVALFLYLLVCDRAVTAGVALGLAIGAKFWPIVLAIVVLKKYWAALRRLLAFALAVSLSTLIVLAPMFMTGPPAFQSLSAYAHYWQANDLIFHLLFVLWKYVLTSWSASHMAGLITVLVVYGVLTLLLLNKPMAGVQPIRTCLWLTTLIFLLSPTEFPWYYTWLLPMLAVCPRPSLLLWSCTLGLYHLSYVIPQVVWIEHLPVLLLLILEAFVPSIRLFFENTPVTPTLMPTSAASGAPERLGR
jgi:hypothetical protein